MTALSISQYLTNAATAMANFLAEETLQARANGMPEEMIEALIEAAIQRADAQLRIDLRDASVDGLIENMRRQYADILKLMEKPQ